MERGRRVGGKGKKYKKKNCYVLCSYKFPVMSVIIMYVKSIPSKLILKREN